MFTWHRLAAQCKGVLWWTNKEIKQEKYKINFHEVILHVKKTFIYPNPILDVDTSSFANKVFHYFFPVLSGCNMQRSPL